MYALRRSSQLRFFAFSIWLANDSVGDLTRYKSQDEWRDNYLSCADDFPVALESLTQPFLELEDRLLELAYAYARAHWMGVRTA
jgi:hypothetical protein